MSGAPAILAVYLTQVLAGLVVVELLRGDTRARRGRFARALLLGPAAIALELLGFHALGVPITLPFALAPWWLAGAVFARRLYRRSEGSAPPRFERVLVGGAVAAFTLLLLQGARFPVYRGDEVNNFAINARVFEVNRSLAPEALNGLIEGGHPEYPPLVALNEALAFQAEGEALGFGAKPFFALAWLAWALNVKPPTRRSIPAPITSPVEESMSLASITASPTKGALPLTFSVSFDAVRIPYTGTLETTSKATLDSSNFVRATCSLIVPEPGRSTIS